jgi:hypothetical protein
MYKVLMVLKATLAPLKRLSIFNATATIAAAGTQHQLVKGNNYFKSALLIGTVFII